LNVASVERSRNRAWWANPANDSFGGHHIEFM